MEVLRVGQMWYPVTTLGYGKRIGVWMQGCRRRCKGCLSLEFQNFAGGNVLAYSDISKLFKVYLKGEKPDGITISGGEPFDQEQGLWALVDTFTREYGDDVLIFTGYSLEQLQAKNSELIEKILAKTAVLVDGEYQEERNLGSGLRGSDNQKIYVWKNQEKYEDATECKRKIQGVFLGDRLWFIGIPPL